MQETGSNIPSNRNVLSIRLVLSGQSFSVASPEGLEMPCTHDVEVELESPDTVLFPDNENLNVRECLLSDGATLPDDSTVITVKGSDNISAAIPVLNNAVDSLKEMFTGKITYVSPLLKAVESVLREMVLRKDVVVLRFSPRTLNVALCRNGRLAYAETLNCSTDDELSYILGVLNNDFDIRHSLIKVTGHASAERCKLIKRYFKHTRCE